MEGPSFQRTVDAGSQDSEELLHENRTNKRRICCSIIECNLFQNAQSKRIQRISKSQLSHHSTDSGWRNTSISGHGPRGRHGQFKPRRSAILFVYQTFFSDLSALGDLCGQSSAAFPDLSVSIASEIERVSEILRPVQCRRTIHPSSGRTNQTEI
jgi:hypothetical protein